MKKILFVFLTLLSTTSFAFFGNSSIKVLCYGDKSVDLIYTYELKDKDIYETVVVPKEQTKTRKNELLNLSKLEDCTIKDSKNWSCGGKFTQTTTGPYRSDLHSVFEGRYKFVVGLILGEQKDTFCSKRIQSN